MNYDEWITRTPNEEGERCDGCGTGLFPEEEARGLCRDCYAQFLENRAEDDAYERGRDDAA